MLMLFSVLDSTKNLIFIGIEQFRVLVRTGPRFSRETRHMQMRNEKVTILALSKGETRKSDDTRAIWDARDSFWTRFIPKKHTGSRVSL